MDGLGRPPFRAVHLWRSVDARIDQADLLPKGGAPETKDNAYSAQDNTQETVKHENRVEHHARARPGALSASCRQSGSVRSSSRQVAPERPLSAGFSFLRIP